LQASCFFARVFSFSQYFPSRFYIFQHFFKQHDNYYTTFSLFTQVLNPKNKQFFYFFFVTFPMLVPNITFSLQFTDNTVILFDYISNIIYTVTKKGSCAHEII